MYRERNPTYKTSIGIALCRREPETNIPQVLLVRTRVTYNYNAFLFGKYKPFDYDVIQNRLHNMTVDEKVIIMTMNFDKMWFHTWLRIPVGTSEPSFYKFYLSCRSKFDKLISRDGGQKLKYLINRSRSIETGWEIPKGRMEPGETEVNCAVRELCEETGVAHNDYVVLHNIKPICTSHEDESNIYKCKYYVGSYNPIANNKNKHLKLDYTNHNQISEISDVGWFGLKEISHLVAQHRLLKEHCKLALKLYKLKN
jgi:8-oxo-dGTP pyrophosphatase MutT (NUDIX family)